MLLDSCFWRRWLWPEGTEVTGWIDGWICNHHQIHIYMYIYIYIIIFIQPPPPQKTPNTRHRPPLQHGEEPFVRVGRGPLSLVLHLRPAAGAARRGVAGAGERFLSCYFCRAFFFLGGGVEFCCVFFLSIRSPINKRIHPSIHPLINPKKNSSASSSPPAREHSSPTCYGLKARAACSGNRTRSRSAWSFYLY